MSVNSLSINRINIYQEHTHQNSMGAVYRTWALLYRNVPARICYIGGKESIRNGKEKVISSHLIFIDLNSIRQKYDVKLKHMIVDIEDGNNYDIINVNELYQGTHIELVAKMVKQIITPDIESSSSESSSSSSSI